ncbi:MAG: HAMP domain-containing histidine kinase [Clostridia bacterium]|nr:HAMP domain-containing histidine kinase [Clostridia bacterium]
MRKKILWTLQLIVLGVLFVYAIFSSHFFYDRLVTGTVETLSKQISKIDFSIEKADKNVANELSYRLSGNPVSIFSLDGELLGSTFAINEQEIPEEVRMAIAYGHGHAVYKVNGQNYAFCCEKVNFSDGERLVRVAMPLQTQGEMLKDMTPTLIWFILLVFLLCFIASYFGTEYIISPITRIAKNSALNMRVETRYEEFQPIVGLLNKRNEEVERQMRELSEEKELVLRAQRSKDDFIANVTHEMNTPLTSIRGYSELLQNGVLDENETKQAADILVKQSERLTKLIARIINYSELDNDDLPLYDVDLSTSINDLLDTLAPSLQKKNVRLNKEIEEGLIVRSRQERVNEVLGNLLRNSIRYNKEDGSLFVALKKNAKGKAKLTITDTGIGIAEENLERIFDRFFTVDKSHNGQGGGFGLGLAMVKKICKLSNWEIRVESKLGEGTTFTLDF